MAALAKRVGLGVESLGQIALGGVLEVIHVRGVVEGNGGVLLGDRADFNHVGLGRLGGGSRGGLGILVAGHAGSFLGTSRDVAMATRALLLLGFLVVATHAAGLGLGSVHGLGKLNVAAVRGTLAGMAAGTGGLVAGMVTGVAVRNRGLMLLMVELRLGQGSLSGLSADGGATHEDLRRLRLGLIPEAHAETGHQGRRQRERQSQETDPAPS